MKSIGALCSILALWPGLTAAFVAPSELRMMAVDARSSPSTHLQAAASRRDFMESVVHTTALGTAAIFSMSAPPALASGGATAGGAYLLSAKQRYNERVKAGVKGYLALGAALEAGDIDALRAYFTSEDTGSWKDLTAAGYLLANAFRRNSTAAPDSLPAVKVRYMLDSSCGRRIVVLPSCRANTQTIYMLTPFCVRLTGLEKVCRFGGRNYQGIEKEGHQRSTGRVQGFHAGTG